MLSTVDSIISAIAFTAHRDLRFIKPANQNSLAPARKWTAGIVIAGLVAYPLLRYVFGTNLPTFLYASYSMQLSLIVVVILALYNKQVEGRAAFASICGGFIMTGISLYLAIKVPDPDAAVLPPIFAVLGAIVAYALFLGRSAITDRSNQKTKS
jgi:Na+/pantothenate symporter